MSHGNSHMFCIIAICIVSAVVHSMLLGGLDFTGFRINVNSRIGAVSGRAVQQFDRPQRLRVRAS